jgi:antitoxin component YwqK of YwqJK toxin-antitoxin module
MRPLLLLVMASTAAFAVQECSVNGKYVNPSNGSTTAGVTGLMVCREDGRVVREEELRDGKYIGVRRFFERDGSIKESHINERGNRDGAYIEKDTQGTVRLEGQYSDGDSVGLFRKFYAGGKRQQVSFQEKARVAASIEYNADGSLREIRCGARSYFAEDREPCGFAGKPVESTLYTRGIASKQTWQSGKLVEMHSPTSEALTQKDGRRVLREFFENGKPRTEVVHEPDASAGLLDRSPNRVEREFAPSGQIVRQSRFQNGVEVEAEDWYLNGKRGRKMTAESPERGTIRHTEHYRDDGSLVRKDHYRGSVMIGTQQHFHANGQLAREDRYEPLEGGRRSYVAARKTWDETGKPLTDDEFFEDGSRKSK